MINFHFSTPEVLTVTIKKIILSSEKPLMSEPSLVPPEGRPPRRKMPDTICEYNRCDWERAHRLLDEAWVKIESPPDLDKKILKRIDDSCKEDEWDSHKIPPFTLP